MIISPFESRATSGKEIVRSTGRERGPCRRMINIRLGRTASKLIFSRP